MRVQHRDDNRAAMGKILEGDEISRRERGGEMGLAGRTGAIAGGTTGGGDAGSCCREGTARREMRWLVQKRGRAERWVGIARLLVGIKNGEMGQRRSRPKKTITSGLGRSRGIRSHITSTLKRILGPRRYRKIVTSISNKIITSNIRATRK